MADKQKVLKGLECCGGRVSCISCPYNGMDDCLDVLKRSAMELLKEQEAVEPEVEVMNEIDRLYRCPKCHKCFFYEKQKYCDQCGQAVTWND